MSRAKSDRRVRYIMDTLDIVMACPERAENFDMVSQAAGMLLGDDFVPTHRFIGWSDDDVRTVVLMYATHIPERMPQIDGMDVWGWTLDDMVRSARERRSWLKSFRLQHEYEQTFQRGAYGDDFEAWKRSLRSARRRTPELAAAS